MSKSSAGMSKAEARAAIRGVVLAAIGKAPHTPEFVDALTDRLVDGLLGELKIGDVVQIHPASDDRFGGCLMIVEKIKSWGYQGYVAIPGEDGPVAYYRVDKENAERVGRAPWLLPE